MNKKTFIKKMEEWKKLEDDISNVDKALRVLSPDFGGFFIDRATTLIEDILKEAMNDEYDYIPYFVYEIDWGKDATKDTITDKDGKNLPIKTLSNLWDLIKNEYDKRLDGK